MKSWIKLMWEIEAEHGADLMDRFGLGMDVGEWGDYAVLKLQKPSWTDGGFGQGVFFSVWLGPKEAKRKRALYNIHALKLRLRKGYAIKSNEFADSFRSEFAALADDWPNVSTRQGPQTLIQGWIPLSRERFKAQTTDLIERFTKLHDIIDRLFEERAQE